jgi:septation ring formation regulator EzrA
LGIFINNEKHPDVFKNQREIKEPNQAYMRQDFMTELIKQQQEANTSLKRALDDLKTNYHVKEAAQTEQIKNIGTQINDLKVSDRHHEENEKQFLQWLKDLDQKNVNLQALLENQLQVKLNQLSQSNQAIVQQLEQQETSYQNLSTQLNEQLNFQKAVTQNQTEFQEDVLKRLDNQEALTEKIHRQLNHIRSVLFERTHFLAGKIEEGYQITSSYVYKLMTGSEKPLTFFLLNQKKEENQQHSD